ncbi:MAG: hypothetical protein HRF45_11370 [Fimbriimonadia bacterium]|jgi:hypothetical protein
MNFVLPLVAALIAGLDADVVCAGRLSGTFPYSLPTLIVERDGFRFRSGGPEFRFAAPVRGGVLPSAGRTEKIIAGGGGSGAPEKLRLHVALPALDLAFGAKMSLRISGWDKAFLTWPGGSVGEGVPAPPDQPWLLLSGSPASPCLAICFSNPPREVLLVRTGGDLVLHVEGERLGWVRLLAPLGVERVASDGAVDLGALAARVAAIADALAGLPPSCQPELRWDSESGRLEISESWGLVPPAVVAKVPLASASQVFADIQTAEGTFRVLSGAATYSLALPVATVEPSDVAHRNEAADTLRGARSASDYVRAYDLRFLLSDDDQQLLRNRLRARATDLAKADAWQDWIEPTTRRSMPKLARAPGADLAEHSEAAALLLAALDWCGPNSDWQAALARCLAVVNLHMDWATLLPMPDGRLPPERLLARCADGTARALLLDWQAPEADRIRYLAARLAVVAPPRPQSAKCPLVLEHPPIGRLLRAEYDANDASVVRLKLAPGPAFALRGPDGSRIQAVEVDGVETRVGRGVAGKWMVQIPERQRPIAVAIRIAPATSGATSEGRLDPGSPR